MVDTDAIMATLNDPQYWMPQRELSPTEQRYFEVLSSHRWAWECELHCQCRIFCNRNGHDAHLAALLAQVL
jgi:hypothetical protein